MFTSEFIRNLILSSQECPDLDSFLAEEGGSLPDSAPYSDGTAEQILRVLWEARDDGLDPLSIRSLSGISRAEFSRRYDIPVRTLEGWECGGINSRKAPEYVLMLLLSDVLNRLYHSDEE